MSSINRALTPTRNQSPEREVYGFRGDTIFVTLDLVRYEIAGEINPSPSNNEFVGVPVNTGFVQIGTIKSGGYELLPQIREPFVKVKRTANLNSEFDLNTYSTMLADEGTEISLPGGIERGIVKSSGLVSRIYAGLDNEFDVYEVDFGSGLTESYHGIRVFIGDPSNKVLLGMMIAATATPEGYALVYPASEIA